MANINGFTEAEIIRLLRMGIELAGDGGMSPWNDGEYEACVEYLNELESRLKARYTMECFNCGELFQYTDEDIQRGYVICPDKTCETKIYLLG